MKQKWFKLVEVFAWLNINNEVGDAVFEVYRKSRVDFTAIVNDPGKRYLIRGQKGDYISERMITHIELHSLYFPVEAIKAHLESIAFSITEAEREAKHKKAK